MIYLGILDGISRSVYNYILSSYSGIAAYSLRKLSSSYSGGAIRVRRSSDNAESDIGFFNNQLDTTSLIQFAGYQNLILRSDNFASSPWETAATITSDVTTDPFGTSLADKIAASGIYNYVLYRRTEINVKNTFSCYIKAAEKSSASLNFSNQVSYSCTAFFDLSSGTVTSVTTSNADYTSISADITNAGNGWWRCSLTATKGSVNTNNNIQINIEGSPTTGQGIYIFGAQLNSPTIQPYQQTTTSASQGNNTLFVTKWYDQSGNARDAVQATAANQPIVVYSGVLQAQGGKPAILFNYAALYLTGIFSGSNLYNISFVAQNYANSVGGIYSVLGTRNDLNGSLGFSGVIRANGTIYYNSPSSAEDIRDVFYSNGSLYVNNHLATTGDPVYTYSQGFGTVGTNNINFHNYGGIDIGVNYATNRSWYGTIQEVIYWLNDNGANRLGIQTNINDNYQIYWKGNNTALLDTNNGAAAAYSLRNLSSTYTGALIRVRRSIDNLEADFYGTYNGALNYQAMQDFVGYQNLFTRSQEFSSAWVTTGAVVAIDVTTAPDGSSTADRVTESAIAGGHGVYRGNVSIASTSANYTTLSVYLKANTRSRAAVSFYYNTGTADQCIAYFDLNNGSLISTAVTGSATIVSTSITNAGNGWWRCSLTGFTTRTGNHDMIFYLVNNSNQNSYTGDGVSNLYIWGAQLNYGVLQKYQATVAAAIDPSGYITKWYDQSGNARDMSQATAANQPSIVVSGVLNTDNGKPSIRFTRTSNSYLIGDVAQESAFDFTNTFSVYVVANPTNTSGACVILNKGDNNFGVTGWYLGHAYNNKYLVLNKGGTPSNFGLTASTNVVTVMSLTSYNLGGGNGIASFNGTIANTYTGVLSSVANNDALRIGAYTTLNNTNNYDGLSSEIIVYPTDKTANRTSIESNINTYYTIY